MRTLRRFGFVFLVLALPSAACAQVFGETDLFGYFQVQLRYSDEQAEGALYNFEQDFTSFSTQQVNVFLQKNLSPKFSAFINAEFTNSFDTERNFGSLRLEEAWVRYAYRDALRFQVGQLVPTFNNLNTIKNRTPLLPYIIRPIVYERSFRSLLPLDAMVPGMAYGEVSGTLRNKRLRFDYAAFVGNNDTQLNVDDGTRFAGTDTTTSVMVGGRSGIRYRGLKAGVSTTYDREYLAIPSMSHVPRWRFGADLSWTYKRLFLESEIVDVQYRLTDEERTAIWTVGTQFTLDGQPNPYFGAAQADKRFAYALVGYNITWRLYTYASYGYYEDQLSLLVREGFDLYTIGGGFRPVDAVTLKLQAVRLNVDNMPVLGFESYNVFVAASVTF